MRTLLTAVSALSLLASTATLAASGVHTPSSHPEAAVPASTPAAEIRKPVVGIKPVKLERRALQMACPSPTSIEMTLFLTGNAWGINPSRLVPSTLTRAYGQQDANDKTKVSLGCVYQATGSYTASVSYNGLQTCPSNSDGDGNVRYKSNLSGYTSNVAGTTAPGLIAVKKTGQQIDGQTLHCHYNVNGTAQFFKVFHAPSPIQTCETTGSQVNCYY